MMYHIVPVDAQFCPDYCCLFSFLGLGPICDEFRVGPRILSFSFYVFIESLSRFCISYLFLFIFRVYSSYLFVICVQMSFYVVSYLIVVINYVSYL